MNKQFCFTPSLFPGAPLWKNHSVCTYSNISVDSLEITGFSDSEIFCRNTFSQVWRDTYLRMVTYKVVCWVWHEETTLLTHAAGKRMLFTHCSLDLLMTLVYFHLSSPRVMVKYSFNSWIDICRIVVFYVMDHTEILMWFYLFDLEPVIIAPENPDIKLLFEFYPGIMCFQLKGWHCEEDAEGVITAITESHQWSQTYTFHSQQ